jgi:hypothetical protein
MQTCFPHFAIQAVAALMTRDKLVAPPRSAWPLWRVVCRRVCAVRTARLAVSALDK